MSADAEVTKLDIAGRIHENVGRLDITVQDAWLTAHGRMQVNEGVGHVAHHLQPWAPQTSEKRSTDLGRKGDARTCSRCRHESGAGATPSSRSRCAPPIVGSSRSCGIQGLVRRSAQPHARFGRTIRADGLDGPPMPWVGRSRGDAREVRTPCPWTSKLPPAQRG